LRPLPCAQPDRLITLGEVRSQNVPDPLAMGTWNASYPDFLDWRGQSKTFESLAGFNGDGFTLRGAGEPESVFAVQVTPNFFPLWESGRSSDAISTPVRTRSRGHTSPS
jgi:hypothetical protein